MATPKITADNKSFLRNILPSARYTLGNWRVLLGLAIAAGAVGLAFNWSWLIAVGLAPILLSTLPCLLMCVFGACIMCRSGKEQPSAQTVDNKNASLATSSANALPASASCCREPARDASPASEGSAKARA